ncbi:DUF362 domain-containing protein [bacterium]|nr:DUF362 domain-containing protein [candidate division CSSED10-310 bacterium]
MHRRTFIISAAATAALAAISRKGYSVSGPARLVTGKNKDYRELVRQTIARLGGMPAFVKPGAVVVIKPNIGWDRTPEQGADTHPVIVTTLIELALEAGASTVKVFDRTCNEARMCYVNSGIGPAVEAISDKRVKIFHVEDRHFVNTRITAGKNLNEWPIHKEVLEADCYINVPVAKHHGLSDLTLGLKNNMGVIGGNRGLIHMSLGQKLADLATVIPTKLTVIDATRMLLRHGPQGGRIEDVHVADTLVASTDPVAADAFATTLFGIRPDSIESTARAYELGLGEMDVAKMDIIRLQ